MNNAKLATLHENVSDTTNIGQLSLLLHNQVSPSFVTCNVTLQNCIPDTAAPCPHVLNPHISLIQPSQYVIQARLRVRTRATRINLAQKPDIGSQGAQPDNLQRQPTPLILHHHHFSCVIFSL